MNSILQYTLRAFMSAVLFTGSVVESASLTVNGTLEVSNSSRVSTLDFFVFEVLVDSKVQILVDAGQSEVRHILSEFGGASNGFIQIGAPTVITLPCTAEHCVDMDGGGLLTRILPSGSYVVSTVWRKAGDWDLYDGLVAIDEDGEGTFRGPIEYNYQLSGVVSGVERWEGDLTTGFLNYRVVPEPSVWILLLSCSALGLVRRQRIR